MNRLSLLTLIALFCFGCSAAVDEKPPLKTAGDVMSEEDEKKAMEESMKRGGDKRYKMPGKGK